ncbi:MAG: geranylgeranylglycerol-phosphate geranylgeranyltransferase [Methanocorpusculum sp.]|nr:geranylgeranylglycerol-phosphate geranylgeranyltransferase [Methanocorpusculum sp.]
MSLTGYLSITRPVNALASGIATAIAYFIVGGSEPYLMGLLCAIVTFICAGGNALNDYFDVEIDTINRPNRPIPSGRVSLRGAFIFSFVLFAAGFVLSFFTGAACIAIALLNILLLIVYSSNFKRMLVFGNVCVAYLSGSLFLFGGLAAGPESLWITAPLFLITFLGTACREMLKDAEDISGDKKAGALTLAMILGVRRTAWAAFFVMLAGILVSFVPYATWGLPYLMVIAPVDVFLFFAARSALSCRTEQELIAKKTTGYLKGGMFAAVLVFLLMAILTRFFIGVFLSQNLLIS